MKFKELFALCLILCQVLGYKFQCTSVEKDILRDKNGKLYLMHSFSKINNHSFDDDPKNVFHLPLTYPSKHLIKIIEHSNSSKYTAQIQSIKYDTIFDFKAMRVDVKNETKDYCGYKQTVTYFVLVMKPFHSKEAKNSIILYGCDILTSGYVKVLMIESVIFSLTIETIDVLLQSHESMTFPLRDYANQGFCICPLSRQYITNCTEIDEHNDRSFNIKIFWIIIGVIIILIILLFVLN